MKIPGLLEINTDLTHNDIKECKVLNLTFSDPHAPRVISELGLIREIRYFKALFKSVLKDLNISEDENVAIVSPTINDLIFNLSIICATNNQNIEYVNQEMYYTGALRRNTHISDTSQDFDPILDEDEDILNDDEINLGDYDVDDLVD
ncbi:hypothetical protein [Aquirufa ecclesiirivi]|uniref:hypothetical protein n=1 Tax=Aquirufa ecclesiirivi TaxID=2715124 RepID=UPI003BB03992